MSVYTLAGIFKLNEQPTTNHRAVIQHAYGEIHSVAEKNGATLIIVILGNTIHPVPVQRDLLPKNVIVVDAHKAMLERLPTKDTNSYRKHYYHWRGNPPRIVDAHPNEKAHRIIAETIISQLFELPNNAN